MVEKGEALRQQKLLANILSLHLAMWLGTVASPFPGLWHLGFLVCGISGPWSVASPVPGLWYLRFLVCGTSVPGLS